MIYELICEGACNPQLAEIDAVLAPIVRQRQRNDGAWNGVTSIGDERLWERQRTLKHTQHEMTAPYRAKCLTCNHERQYGKGLF